MPDTKKIETLSGKIIMIMITYKRQDVKNIASMNWIAEDSEIGGKKQDALH